MKIFKKLAALILTFALVLSAGIFAACDGGNDNDGTTGGDNSSTTGGENGGSTGGSTGGENGGSTGGENGDTTGGENGGTLTPSEPVISGPVAGGPTITKASSGELESAYVEWTAADNAKWYNVYYKGETGDWTKLDDPLVRQYSTYFRADAVGLKAGEYSMKVVPVSGDDTGNTEATDYAATAGSMTVYAQERSGYAFTGGNVPGAYNMDGTLKTGAQVVYVTAANAKTVTATVNGAEVTGFQSIIDARNKGAKDPICFRIVGTVNKSDLDHISSSEEGLQIKGKSKNEPTENITIEGIGSDGTINGFGMLIRYCKNVEIKNLGIINFMDDGVSIDTGDSHLWVHNLDIFYGNVGGDSDQAKGDGSLDSKDCDYSTYSYNHFWDSGKSNLLGNGTSESGGEGGATHLTYHHNWYDHSDSRHPRIRIATVHIYNNYFDGNSKYGVGVTTGASAFVENNYYRSTATMKPMLSSLQGTDIAHGTAGQTFSGESGGMIKAYGNHFEGNYELLTQNDTDANNIDCYMATSRNEQVPATYVTKQGGTTYNNFDTASGFYTYTADSAEKAKENVVRYAGRVDGGDLKWEFDNATEDSNYSIIPALKALVVGYKSDVVKIGGTAVSSGSTGGNTGNESGGNSGTTTPPAAVEGEITYNPETDGVTGKGAVTVSGGAYKSKSTAVTIDGVSISSGKALKFNSGASISFTLTEEMTITVYVDKNGVKVTDAEEVTTEKTGVSESNYYKITFDLPAGSYTLKQGSGGETQLYMLKLTPKS